MCEWTVHPSVQPQHAKVPLTRLEVLALYLYVDILPFELKRLVSSGSANFTASRKKLSGNANPVTNLNDLDSSRKVA